MLQVLERLTAADPWGLSLSDQLDGVGEWERVRAWVEAQQAAWIAAAIRPRPEEPLWDEDWAAREDIALALNVSPMAAHRRIEHATALDGPLVAARDAMIAGRLARSRRSP